ncbi:MAG: zf-TFIIB domain-containing protein [Candidatus Methylomirabilales bacterium]
MSTSVQTRKCEHCGKRINIRSRICPFCAGTIQDPVVRRKAVCPRCAVPLEIHRTPDDQEEYDLCPRCQGLWLDKPEFHRATRKRTVYRSHRDRKEYVRGSLQDLPQYIPCVRCGKVMNRKNFARISGVIIDACRSHGVWLDAGELDKIQHFIADGGLEASRDKEIERVRTELKELATKLGQVAFTHRLIHYWNPKRWLFTGFR